MIGELKLVMFLLIVCVIFVCVYMRACVRACRFVKVKFSWGLALRYETMLSCL